MSTDHPQTRWIPGPGEALSARLHTPPGTGPHPVIVYFPGASAAVCRVLSEAAQAIVLAIQIRDGEPFPAPVEDAYAALQWAIENAPTFGGDPARVAVAGEGTGASAATVACHLARDRGGRRPVCQVLACPVVEWTFDRPSYRENGAAAPLTVEVMGELRARFLPDMRARTSPLAAPIMGNLTGLPAAFVITAGHDVLRDEGEDYAGRMAAAGTPAEYKRYEGRAHGFFGAAGDPAREALDDAARILRRAFEGRALAAPKRARERSSRDSERRPRA